MANNPINKEYLMDAIEYLSKLVKTEIKNNNENYYTKTNIDTLLENKANNSTVTTLSGTVDTLSGTVNTLDGEVDTLSGNYNTLNTTVGTLNTTVGGLDEDMTSVENRLTTVEETLNNLVDGDTTSY